MHVHQVLKHYITTANAVTSNIAVIPVVPLTRITKYLRNYEHRTQFFPDRLLATPINRTCVDRSERNKFLMINMMLTYNI